LERVKQEITARSWHSADLLAAVDLLLIRIPDGCGNMVQVLFAAGPSKSARGPAAGRSWLVYGVLRLGLGLERFHQLGPFLPVPAVGRRKVLGVGGHDGPQFFDGFGVAFREVVFFAGIGRQIVEFGSGGQPAGVIGCEQKPGGKKGALDARV